MASDDPSTRPSAGEHYRYIRNFLAVLVAAFGGVAIVLLAYDGFTSGRASQARALLDVEPDAVALKKALQLAESPHLFS